MSIREVAEGLLEQGSDESLAYSIATANWASEPTDVSVKVYDENVMVDVTSTVMPANFPSVTDDVISLWRLENLTQGAFYRVEVQFTANGNVYECYFRVRCVG
ncbi:hypothetical protein LCGC14_1589220 [marine sediment metagenome]|uniref:Uncharacterized protein n=1 Tax=marine sediment metagenome TaxID=412755 RepID=A0A0F9IEW8_9ZZZZ